MTTAELTPTDKAKAELQVLAGKLKTAGWTQVQLNGAKGSAIEFSFSVRPRPVSKKRKPLFRSFSLRKSFAR